MTIGVHAAEVVLVLGKVLFGGLAVPGQRRRVVLRHALAVLVTVAESGLGTGIALVGKRPPQTQRGRVVALLRGCEPILERSRNCRPSRTHEQAQQQFQ